MKLRLTDGKLVMENFDEELFIAVVLSVGLDYDFLMGGYMMVAETMFDSFHRISKEWEDSDLVTLTEEEGAFGIEAHVVTSAGQEVEGGQLAEAIGFLLVWGAEHYFPGEVVTVKHLIEHIIEKDKNGEDNETL